MPSGSLDRSAEQVFPPVGGDVIVVTGATASGKSTVAIALAERLGGEIVSVDSVAVYRGMDIGSAKPSTDQRRRVPHHLLDVASPAEAYSVAQYLTQAWQAIRLIRQRGRRPILVGGTPLYLKGLLHGFDPGPPPDWGFRDRVQSDLDRYGPQALHRRLWQVDPLSAHRLAASDTRRIIRALEVAYLTGRPLSHRQTQFEAIPAGAADRRFILRWPRATLHERIAARVEAMFAAGLVDEVRGLVDRYTKLSRTARIAVGYREVVEHLQGRLSLDEAIAQVIAHSRQLARRQETWLRRLDGLSVAGLQDEGDLADTGRRLASVVVK